MARTRLRREEELSVRTSLSGSTIIAGPLAAPTHREGRHVLRRSRRVRGLPPREFERGIRKKRKKRKPTSHNNTKRNLVAYWALQGNRWPPGLLGTTMTMDVSTQASGRASPFARTAMMQSATSQGLKAPNRTESSAKTKSSKKEDYGGSEFWTILQKGNGSMRSHAYGLKSGANDRSKKWCEDLKKNEQAIPPDPRFLDDEVFQLRLKRLPNRSEAKVFHFLQDFVCPSAEQLSIANRNDPELASDYERLVDAINEGWGDGFTLYKDLRKPQPDYCVGFEEKEFSEEQQEKIMQVTGDGHRFAPTRTMIFPFLACEAKSKQSIEDAKRQNAHTLTLATMAVVELFRGAGLEDSIHREILGFSIAYDSQSAEVRCHYPAISREKTHIYFDSVFDISFKHSIDRWALYRFVKNVYELWAPQHFHRISDALDRLNPSWTISSATTHSVRSRYNSTPTVDESAHDMQQLGIHSVAPSEAVGQSPQAATDASERPDAQSTASTERQRRPTKRRRGRKNG